MRWYPESKGELPEVRRKELEVLLSGIVSLMDTPQGDIIERDYFNVLVRLQQDYDVKEFWRRYEEIIGQNPSGRYFIVEPRTRGFGTLLPKDKQKDLEEMLNEIIAMKDAHGFCDTIEMEFWRILLDYKGRFYDVKKLEKTYYEKVGPFYERIEGILRREWIAGGMRGNPPFYTQPFPDDWAP